MYSHTLYNKYREGRWDQRYGKKAFLLDMWGTIMVIADFGLDINTVKQNFDYNKQIGQARCSSMRPPQVVSVRRPPPVSRGSETAGGRGDRTAHRAFVDF